jgi:hypothetical protein
MNYYFFVDTSQQNKLEWIGKLYLKNTSLFCLNVNCEEKKVLKIDNTW